MLPAIELAAARLLAGYASASVLAETTSQLRLQSAQSEGRLLVVLASDVPVGFAHIELREPDAAHLEEIDVHPNHGRRGLGRRLVNEVCAWAEHRGLSAVTLITFREPPWNMPFYAKLGFEEMRLPQLSVALLAAVDDETQRGLDASRRVVMRRPIGHAQGKA